MMMLFLVTVVVSFKLPPKYDAANAKIWQTLGDEEIYCKRCLGIKQRGTKTDMVKCNGECQQDLPDYHFIDLMIVEARKVESSFALKCARCMVKEKTSMKNRNANANDAENTNMYQSTEL